MTDIERYEPREVAIRAATDTDSWTEILAQVGELASKIADTEFVPESLRGRTPAVAATILAGREMGVGPMTSLQNIHVIKGKPGQSAQLMRQLVLAHGHQISYVETTDSRCVVKGRRLGESDWEVVTFTADQAKKARIDLGGYPEDKLVARATSRLCRRKFADCLGGMPYSVEELEDPEHGETPAELPSANGDAAGKSASMKRRSTPKRQTKTTAKPAAEPQPAADEPPLPGDEAYEPAESSESGPAAITWEQSKRLHATFRDAGIEDRDARLAVVRQVLSRDVASSNELTKAEAATLIDTLAELHNDGALVELVASLTGQPAAEPDPAPADTEETT